MAYNILAESNQKVNWASLHADVYSDNILIEFLPLPGQGLSGGDAIGLSVPSKNCGKEAWQQLVRIMRVLKDRYKMDLYDLYSGKKVGFFTLSTIKRNIIMRTSESTWQS